MWLLVFVMYMPSGAVHTNSIHGYTTSGACSFEAKQFSKRFDWIKWQCVQDNDLTKQVSYGK